MANKKRTIYLIAFLYLVLIIGFGSAYYDWSRYGGGVRMDSTNTNFAELYLQLNSTPSRDTFSSVLDNRINIGNYDYVFQENNYTNVLFLHFSGYTKVLNSNLVEIFEFYNNATLLGQDFQYPLGQNTYRYMGLFKKNNTNIQFITYNISTTPQTAPVNTFIDLNFPSAVTTQGINCISFSGGYKCTAYISNATATKVYEFFENGTTNILPVQIPSGATTRIPQFLDITNDGELEYIYVDNDHGIVFNKDIILINQTPSGVNYFNRDIIDVKFFATGVNCGFWSCVPTPTTTYKVAILQAKVVSLNFEASDIDITYYRPDGSIYNGVNHAILESYYGNGLSTTSAVEMSIADSNRDGNEEVSVAYRITGFANGKLKQLNYYGVPIYSRDIDYSMSRIIQLRANNNDQLYDYMIIGGGTGATLLDTSNNQTLNINNVGNIIPQDINTDGGLELVGKSGTGQVIIIYSNYTNSNAVLNSLTLSPSSTLGIGEALSVTINASDTDLDPLKYYVDCGNGVITGEDYSSVKSCTYNSVGVYNLIAYVRDVFHFTYDSFSTPITITQSGLTCNLNSICESGETYVNCPSDCTAPSNTTTITGSSGGITIPTELVNIENEDEGFLPQIYAGILLFLSNSLLPIFSLVFIVFIVLIILAIATIIKKVAVKVSSLK